MRTRTFFICIWCPRFCEKYEFFQWIWSRFVLGKKFSDTDPFQITESLRNCSQSITKFLNPYNPKHQTLKTRVNFIQCIDTCSYYKFCENDQNSMFLFNPWRNIEKYECFYNSMKLKEIIIKKQLFFLSTLFFKYRIFVSTVTLLKVDPGKFDLSSGFQD